VFRAWQHAQKGPKMRPYSVRRCNVLLSQLLKGSEWLTFW